MDKLEQNINLISPIDSIKIMIDLFKGNKESIKTTDTYLSNLFENKYFLYFVATKQNYRENILLELDLILRNEYIKNHEVVKIILANSSLIDLIPELLDIQLNLIYKSHLKNFFSQQQFIEWKEWIIKYKDTTHHILRNAMTNFIPIIDKYIDLYKSNPNKCGLHGLDINFYYYYLQANITLPLGTQIPLDLLLEFANKERNKLEKMIREIIEKKKPVLKELKFNRVLKYIRSKSCYKYNSREDLLERHKKEIDRLHEYYNSIFNYNVKCNFVDMSNENFHGLYMYDTFFINSSNWMNETTLTVKDLVAHETAPGHHLQIIIDKQKPSNHNILMHHFGFLSNGFCEGWGLFAEKLIPSISEEDLLGILFGNIHRTIRVMAEIMINYKGKSIDSVYSLYKNNTMLSKKEIMSEIRRIQVMPGQVLCYKLGDQVFRKIFIKALSNQESLLSHKAMEFYKEILSNGSQPLETLLKKYDIPITELFNFIEM